MPRPARDPSLRTYRVALYAAYGIVCALLFLQLIRSIAGDLYGGQRGDSRKESPTACLDDIDRLYQQLSARAVQPAPRGIESGQLARDWDAWSRRWESDVETVSSRCDLKSKEPAMIHLADALDGIEELRRRIARSGEEAAADAARVKESLDEARASLRVR